MAENRYIEEQLKRLEARLDGNDRFRHELRGKQEKVTLEQAVLNTQLDNISKDVEELGTRLDQRLDNIDKKVEARLGSINRALWAGFTVFLTAFLTVLGFIFTQGVPT